MHFWNKKIINLEDKYFGVDISDLSVKVFQLEKKGNIDKIRSFGIENLDKGCVQNGIIVDEEKLVKIIKRVVQKAGPKKINTKKVICSVPESKSFLRTINLPLISEEEAHESIKWEIESNIPLSVEDVYYDWQFLNKKDGKQNVLAVAVAKKVINDLVGVLEKSDFSVYGIETETVAMARSLVAKETKITEVSFIVDLGKNKTSFIITEGNIPCFTSSIPFSSVGLTDSIAKAFKISQPEAEKLKVNKGIEHSFENQDIFNIAGSLLENLAIEIEKTMDFYQNMSKIPKRIKRIIISGGGAALKGLIPYLTTRLSQEVIAGDPWINLNLGRRLPIISKGESTRYATVIGLAMREINYEDNA